MKKISLVAIITVYILAGINHFIHPEFYRKIMPPSLPYHDHLIYISGLFEIIFAILLIFKNTRNLAAWGIIALLIAIFPANIQMLINYIHQHHPATWLAIVRLPLQLLLIWWAYTFTNRAQRHLLKVK